MPIHVKPCYTCNELTRHVSYSNLEEPKCEECGNTNKIKEDEDNA